MRRFRCLLEGDCCRMSPITIFPFEKPILERLAEKLGVEIVIRPGYTVYDRVSGYRIALSYVLELDEEGRCPFLTRGNLCSIHRYYKPYTCRTYPYVPREVRYMFVKEARLIYARVEYGLSMHCPVIKRDREYIDRMLAADPFFIAKYMPEEYMAALEAEDKRRTLLAALTSLWRRGIVELEASENVEAQVLNLYELLRKYYPGLPLELGLHRVHEVLRRLG